ncbi:MAG: hypothetical protein FWH38_08615, partial [Treponema sp.]|nr:hypothetical protein [Treponema sp.]
MRKIKACGFSFLLLVMAPLFVAPLLGAQELNSVPLDHASYDIIEFGVIRGLVSPPPLAKPWSVRTVREKLWEMLDGPPGVLSPKEIEIIDNVLDSLKGKSGLDLQRGKYRIEKDRLTFETGIGWESGFSVDFPYFARLKKDAEYSGEAFASVNTAEIYACGDLGAFFSWNVTALGELLGIGRYENDEPLALPWSLSKGWDRGVISMREPGAYSAWPDDPALAGSLLGEVNTASAGESLQLRLGRIRRDWGPQANGTSLFMNAQARPFLGFEWINSPVPWVYYYILLGGTEYYRESEEWPGNGPVSNTLAAAQFEINPVRFLHFGLGGSAVLQETLNTAVFTDIELRLPGIFKLWGSLFVDSLDSPNENFPLMNSNSYAWQAGIKAAVNWLPFAAFTLRYTKIEPYCYTNPYEGRTRAWS